ncbi:hypothetical protein G6L94_31015 [Agrobacterium rhizogenes]|uniref:hypothetical protein n=1 Tax=Rhizobium rhizogenes TaxID=359 RepID=UPI00080F8FC9|nr:hypothetical protein [Rhizobium rhizogenes]OCJ17152.1 hypothetical protein A6U88_33605 [Agrobacterium sp. B131/95]OCJ27348.1 hypothetical protein A6U89_29720 [Agrobacterium sp. B133/95]NTI46632.1 hypothetical protein [Rhizobium rhizogenes]NTI52760.1 hypothetical protein [Rhizobium rhizogenes]NTI98133.1 hypothetical protein [Rhizobium rhizogenes]
MQISKDHFLLKDISPFQGRSWIPLHQVQRRQCSSNETAIDDAEEWIGTGTAAIYKNKREAAERLGWDDLGVQPHTAYVQYGEYRSVDVFRNWQGEELGQKLVIVQNLDGVESEVWHLHHDLVVALHLIKEADFWLCPQEQFKQVVRLVRDTSGKPAVLEIRKEYLVDYLAARGMDLYCSSYIERTWRTPSKPPFLFESSDIQTDGLDTYETYTREARFPDPQGSFVTLGALWRTEWVLSGDVSLRVRGDPEPQTASFVIDVDGKRVTGGELPSISYLYFDPSLVEGLLRCKGSKLGWYSGETGALGAGSLVHFGINDLGIITVLAKDIGQLPQWEQRLWSAFNMTPEGKVSNELFAAQMMVSPAGTIAPETLIEKAAEAVNVAFHDKYGRFLLKFHESVPNLLMNIHRFKAIDEDGILELAKDLTRFFVERLDQNALAKPLNLQEGEKRLGSLKLLENILCLHVSESEAKQIMSPLFGIYDLRLADAHLGSSRVESGKQRAGVDDGPPGPMRGRQLLQSFCNSLFRIGQVISSE